MAACGRLLLRPNYLRPSLHTYSSPFAPSIRWRSRPRPGQTPLLQACLSSGRQVTRSDNTRDGDDQGGNDKPPKNEEVERTWFRQKYHELRREGAHYKNGFKLLGSEFVQAGTLIGSSLRRDLTYAEREVIWVAVVDILKLMPFVALVAAPGGTLLVPLLARLWPSLLPSTFQQQVSEAQQKMSEGAQGQAEFTKEMNAEISMILARMDSQTERAAALTTEFERLAPDIDTLDGMRALSEAMGKDENVLSRLAGDRLLDACSLLSLSMRAGAQPPRNAGLARFLLRRWHQQLKSTLRRHKSGGGNGNGNGNGTSSSAGVGTGVSQETLDLLAAHVAGMSANDGTPSGASSTSSTSSASSFSSVQSTTKKGGDSDSVDAAAAVVPKVLSDAFSSGGILPLVVVMSASRVAGGTTSSP